MKGIIYCQKLETGLDQFKKIIEDYNRLGIKGEKPKINTNLAFVDFDNGDRWVVMRANENVRGNVCNIAYIDRMIDEELVETIIMPTIKAAPYQAYKYYNWGNW
jgi:hypothetical protein